MGIQHLGAFGGFQGKAGALVGHRVNGQNVITGIPFPSQVAPTQLQLDVRTKFSVMVNFLRPINVLLRAGFSQVKKETESGFNAAFRTNYRTIGNVAPFAIDYSEVLLSKGGLSMADDLTAAAVVVCQITFTWTDLIYMDAGSPTDKATFVVYCPVRDKYLVMTAIVARSVKTFTITLPNDFSGEEVHTWTTMISADGKKVSDSVYLGPLPIL